MKILTILKLCFLLVVFSSCSSLSGFAPEKGATGEEFLIQKKNALVMPPDYNDLPIPSSKKSDSDNNSKKVISLLGIDNTSSTKINTENDTLENSILEKIKNN